MSSCTGFVPASRSVAQRNNVLLMPRSIPTPAYSSVPLVTPEAWFVLTLTSEPMQRVTSSVMDASPAIILIGPCRRRGRRWRQPAWVCGPAPKEEAHQPRVLIVCFGGRLVGNNLMHRTIKHIILPDDEKDVTGALFVYPCARSDKRRLVLTDEPHAVDARREPPVGVLCHVARQPPTHVIGPDFLCLRQEPVALAHRPTHPLQPLRPHPWQQMFHPIDAHSWMPFFPFLPFGFPFRFFGTASPSFTDAASCTTAASATLRWPFGLSSLANSLAETPGRSSMSCRRCSSDLAALAACSSSASLRRASFLPGKFILFIDQVPPQMSSAFTGLMSTVSTQ